MRAREATRGLTGTLTFGLIGAASFKVMPMLIAEVARVAPVAQCEVIAVKDLEHEPILNLSRTYDAAAHDFYLGLYRTAGFEPNLVHEVSQIATILFVIATCGCVSLGSAGWEVLRREGFFPLPIGRARATSLDAPSPSYS